MSTEYYSYLKPLGKYGFKKLNVQQEKGRITHIDILTKPRKIEDLQEGELQLRSEVHHMLGSELITYGLEKLINLFSRVRSGEEKKEIKSILKYSVTRAAPDYVEEEKKRVEELYYDKVNAPVKRVVEVVEDRVKKGKKLMDDTDKYIRSETRDVAIKEVGKRIRRTGEELGLNVNRLTQTSEKIFGRILNILTEDSETAIEPIEYRASVRSLDSSKPQVIIHQSEHGLRIMGGSEFDDEFDDVDPELLKDVFIFMFSSKKLKEG